MLSVVHQMITQVEATGEHLGSSGTCYPSFAQTIKSAENNVMKAYYFIMLLTKGHPKGISYVVSVQSLPSFTSKMPNWSRAQLEIYRLNDMFKQHII